MKRSKEENNPSSIKSKIIRNTSDRFKRGDLFFAYLLPFLPSSAKRFGIKILLLSGLFLLMALRLSAPERRALHIFEPEVIEPFNHLIYAIGMVETRGDTLAYNHTEQAAGLLQIRPVRIEDYNRRTGSRYSLDDMFSYEISRKIFLYYASLIGPYDLERITKNWNGSGPMTELYWKRVKKYL